MARGLRRSPRFALDLNFAISLKAVAEASQPPNDGDAEARSRALAIALQKDPGAAERPRVVAKGHGAVAEQILQIAFERGVKVRTDADLAEILGAVELESEIPLEALAAVAEILTYVYRATQGGAPSGESPSGESPSGESR